MVLNTLQQPQHNGDSLRIPLQTLTWLYTGGIGQHGEQIHPSGLLGSLRAFSVALANAVGDRDFAEKVWGSAQSHPSKAKQVALRWETSTLRKATLPAQIHIPKTTGENSRWFFNCAQDGDLALVLTRRGISDAHWNLLLLALRIQIQHATLGAKDQFGLGVLQSSALPKVQPLKSTETHLNHLPGLHHSVFARITFKPQHTLNAEQRLKAGLSWRSYLRGCFRPANKNAADEKLRHYLFGNMKGQHQYGSAINISAAYPIDEGYEIRIWGLLPHTTHCEILPLIEQAKPRLRKALEGGPDDFAGIRQRQIQLSPKAGELCAWLNQLAGV